MDVSLQEVLKVPHSCAGCGRVYASLAELNGGACPVCHARKFIYEDSRNVVSHADDSLLEDGSHEKVSKDESTGAAKRESDAESGDDTISVLIKQPGSYEINLRQMVESSDRIIGVERKGVYHLDLHSMVLKKKDKR